MSREDSAIAVLRAATRDAHAALERTLAVAEPGAGREEYLHYAMALLGWMKPFEDRLWSSPWPAGMNSASRAGKCAWIARDLRDAGIDPARIPLCSCAPDLSTLPARLGLAYVIEGAQLGTRVLLKRLAPHLDGWTPRWLQGYGNDTAENWRAFLVLMEDHLRTREDRAEAARAAHAAFVSLGAWFAG